MALAAYDRARELGVASRTTRRRDQAVLNVAMVRLQTEPGAEADEGLREILLRTTDPRIAYHAAYNLAAACAARHGTSAPWPTPGAPWSGPAIGADEFLAPAHNLLGNIHLTQSYLEEALAEYETALAIARGAGRGHALLPRHPAARTSAIVS